MFRVLRSQGYGAGWELEVLGFRVQGLGFRV